MLTNRQKLWLIYKRLRVSIGIFGFILMYGIITQQISFSLIVIGIGLAFIELFGATYNDYTDYGEDIQNQRFEKLTVSGFLTLDQTKYLSFFSLSLGLLLLLYMSPIIFALGIYYSIFLFLYSNPNYFIKQYNVIGYIAVESFWIIFPLLLSTFYLSSITFTSILFSMFVFSQYVYILCQKDSTDPNDRTNLFLARGWKKGSIVCGLFALLSSFALLIISLSSIVFFGIWLLNVILKVLNVSNIYKKSINRKLRSKLILAEFLTPYLYLVGVI